MMVGSGPTINVSPGICVEVDPVVEPSKVDQAPREEVTGWNHFGGEGELANEREEFPLGSWPFFQPAFDDSSDFLQLGKG